MYNRSWDGDHEQPHGYSRSTDYTSRSRGYDERDERQREHEAEDRYTRAGGRRTDDFRHSESNPRRGGDGGYQDERYPRDRSRGRDDRRDDARGGRDEVRPRSREWRRDDYRGRERNANTRCSDGGRGFQNRGRGGGRGGGGRGRQGPGAGQVSGSGYEDIGSTTMDPERRYEWSGRAEAQAVPSDDAALQAGVQLCHRPTTGARQGRSIDLEVNFFGVRLRSQPREIFQYDVTVERTRDARYGPPGDAGSTEPGEVTAGGPTPPGPPVQDGQSDRPIPKAVVTSAINGALEQYATVFEGHRVVHDGVATLYSPAMFSWNSFEFKDVRPRRTSSTSSSEAAARNPRPVLHVESRGCAEAPQLRNFRGQTFIVKVKLSAVIDTSAMDAYLIDPKVDVQPLLHALDVVARYQSSQKLITAGSKLISTTHTKSLSSGKELCWGYRQTLRVTERKLLLNVDQTTRVCYAEGPLENLVAKALSVHRLEDIRCLSEKEVKKLARVLRRIKVEPTHRSERPRPINGVSSQPTDKTMITIADKEKSVAAYFLGRYQLRLQFPALPPVNVGGRRPGTETWLPIELCRVTKGQLCHDEEENDARETIRLSSQEPKKRQANIAARVREAEFDKDPYLAAFGLGVECRFQRTRARVLDAPDVQYANVSEQPSSGQWNLRGKRFVDGVHVQNWGTIVLADMKDDQLDYFLDRLTAVGENHRLVFSKPIRIHHNEYDNMPLESLITFCFEELTRREDEHGPPQLLMVVKPDNNSEEYGRIKYTSDIVLGLPSQCAVVTTLLNSKDKPDLDQICGNLCLKMNLKLNGKNAVLRQPLPLVSSSPTIVFGVAVEHPRPGMDKPSIAAVVASMDRYSAQYVPRVAAQTSSNDVQHLPRMLRELFLAYYQSTEREPEHIIYYRDGVDEGRMEGVLKGEVGAIRKAFKMISAGKAPPITFIMANKRTSLRSFLVNPRDGDKKGNVRPGTVIDTGVVDPHRFDFYLYGHTGIQGTSVPCHYTVMFNENNLSAEQIQRLTYHLGFTSPRTTRSISVATPVKCAQLAAQRAQIYQQEGGDGGSATGSDSISTASTYEFAEVHAGVRNRMYYT